MKITILTLFPEMFAGPFSESILKRAREKKLIEINIVNIRDFGIGKHKIVDDKPYGGGVGMVMKVDVLDRALQSVKKPRQSIATQKAIFLDPRGRQFKQSTAKSYSKLENLIILCGHYEGIDERARELVDETVSVGDFVLTGGEIPAMLITDAVTRLIPGVLKEDATAYESFSIGVEGMAQGGGERQNLETLLLEYPQYTTPSDYKGMKVPDILLSGNHKEIEKWRLEKSQEITQSLRPDLLRAG